MLPSLGCVTLFPKLSIYIELYQHGTMTNDLEQRRLTDDTRHGTITRNDMTADTILKWWHEKYENEWWWNEMNDDEMKKIKNDENMTGDTRRWHMTADMHNDRR